MTPEERALGVFPLLLDSYVPPIEPDPVDLLRAKVTNAIEDAIAAERARICKILRETSVNATRELLIRGVEEGATSIWVEDKL
jgi:hypothetical protein